MIEKSVPREKIKGLEQFRIKTLGKSAVKKRRDSSASSIHEQIQKSSENKYLPQRVKVLKYKRETADDFIIRVDFKTEHEPGQFVQLGLPGYGECPISICSYSNKYMDFNIREVGNLTKKFAQLKKGDEIWVRGPYGTGYQMKKFKGNDLIIIGGGCGVAPLKGIINYVDKYREEYGNVSLFLGFRSPKDIIFRHQLVRWRQDYELHLSVDTNPDNLDMGCDVCYVTQLLERAQFNSEGKTVFVCGPSVMINLVINILKSKGFVDSQIYISLERLMKCGIGLCGHCMIDGVYVCKDGPVIRYDLLKELKS